MNAHIENLIDDAIETFQRGDDIDFWQETTLLEVGVDVQALREQHTPE